MNGILELADNDNIIASIICNTELNIGVEKWNGIKCCIVGIECSKFVVNSVIGFEIGEIVIKNVEEQGDTFESDFVLENKDYLLYKELIIYDPWIPSRINLRAIGKNFSIKYY